VHAANGEHHSKVEAFVKTPQYGDMGLGIFPAAEAVLLTTRSTSMIH